MQEIDETNDVNLYTLIELVKIPEFNRYLRLKVDDVKNGTLNKYAVEYKKKEDKYNEELFIRIRDQQEEAGEEEYPPLYWFELTRFRLWDWGITILSPWPPPYEPYYNVVPRDIIRRITASFPVDPDMVITIKALQSKEVDKKVDLQFVRLSSNHIVGTVRENLDDWQEVFNGDRDVLEKDLDAAFRLFFYYLHKYPDLNKEFMQRYIKKMIPKLKEMEAEAG
ncbi:MAG: hypothetical protein GTO45_05745 [Candidatus Aminicenantes bacterium]|nr:hypothetical protein [Candidatus Aminicenantes bacterium]NIM78353.1 hypothetical protein [Candidatus Aminicenantes bacterium]NIN17587.1 hypothetical protein [Candidatus Aminicenantes bacterium]NIN41465.1 hypothetical protein [Candidatus Aminicenantes bacterium]NIN84239.1 hypothetical protein [Candidatus Aminicenantes bacterium]